MTSTLEPRWVHMCTSVCASGLSQRRMLAGYPVLLLKERIERESSMANCSCPFDWDIVIKQLGYSEVHPQPECYLGSFRSPNNIVIVGVEWGKYLPWLSACRLQPALVHALSFILFWAKVNWSNSLIPQCCLSTSVVIWSFSSISMRECRLFFCYSLWCLLCLSMRVHFKYTLWKYLISPSFTFGVGFFSAF